MMETPAIIRKIFWAAQNGYDAVISSNTFDPGVDGGQAGGQYSGDRTVAHVDACRAHARRSGRHHGAAAAARALYVAHPAHFGLDRFVSDIRPIGVYGEDIAERKQEIFGITEKLIRGLIDETRAEIILPLGGALIPYVVDPDDLAKATGMQVLNTKAIGIRFAEMCVAFGMTQSALTYPRAKMTYEDFTNRS